MSPGHVGSQASPPPDPRSKELSPQVPRTLPPLHPNSGYGAPKALGQPPPAMQGASGPPSRPPSDLGHRTARPFGVQNLLNPSANELSEGQGRRRPSELYEYPSPAPSTTSQMRSTSLSQSPAAGSLHSFTPPQTNAYPTGAGQTPRQALNTRSASAFAPHPNTINPPNATIDASQSPFVLAKDRSSSTGPQQIGYPDMAAGSLLGGQPYGHPVGPPRPLQGRQFGGERQPSQTSLERQHSTGSQRQGSYDNSPSTSYSSHSQFSHTPPASINPPQTSDQPESSFTDSGTLRKISRTAFSSADAFRATAIGQSTYQMMTLDTEQGPIQVPVDVQAASKVADEKRKRNATASHRFRQRRKEKERETSQNIAKLEQDLRDQTSEAEYYRVERDFFRDLAHKSGVKVGPRPASPRTLRFQQYSGYGPYGAGQGQSTEGVDRPIRNTRRRTSNYVPPQGPPPQATAPPIPMPQMGHITSHPSESMDIHNRGPPPPPLGLKNIFEPTGPPSQ